MMNWLLSVFWLWFVPSVLGIFLEDRTKSWIQYNHGPIVDYQLLNGDSLVAITEENELIKFKVDDSRNTSCSLSWKIPIESPIVDYVFDPLFIVMSTKEKGGFVFDGATGALISQVDLIPKAISVTPHGVVMLMSQNEVVCVTANGNLRTLNITTKDIKVSYYNDVTYILSKELTLYKYNSNWQLIESKPISFVTFDSITQLVDNAVLANGQQIYNLDTENFIHSYKGLHLISNTVSYSFHNKKFHVFVGDKSVTTNDFDVANDKLVFIDNKFIIQYDDNWEVLDMNKFMDNWDETSIVVDNFNASDFNRNKVYSFGNDQISSVAIDDNKTIRVTTYNIAQEKLFTSTCKLNNYKLTYPKTLLINKPESREISKSIDSLVDEIVNNNLFIRWGKRLKRHLRELGEFAVSKVTNSKSLDISSGGHIENPFSFEKLLVFVNNHDILTTTDSLTGKTVWETKIRSDKQLKHLSYDEDKLEVILTYLDEVMSVNIRDGMVTETTVHKNTAKVENTYNNESIYVEQADDNSIVGYKCQDTQGKKLEPAWKFTTSSKTSKILKYKFHGDHKLNSIGIPLHDKSVLYKYLDYNLISLFTIDTAHTNNLKFYLINGETGTVIYYHEHPQTDQTIELSSLNIIMQDNWVIYSYYVTSPKPQQRILVLDLFTDKQNNLQSSIKTFIFPNKIVNLESTFSRFGITIKSIVALTDMGELIELPKYLLNSRRIDDRVLTPEDQRDDFRMMPYEPIIYKNNYQILNHQYKLEVELDGNNQILIDNTKLESTIIVCLINDKNKFCSRLQPSLTFDLLPENFDKIKLILTIVIILVVYLITKPMVLKKRLNNNWKYT